MPLSVNLSSFALIFSIALKLLQVFILKHNLFHTKAAKYSSLIGLCFFIYIILSCLIQKGFAYTLGSFEKQFFRWELLFLVPILLKGAKENLLLLYFFFLGIVCAIVYVIIIVLIYQMSFSQDSLLKILDIHHTYLSIFLMFFVNYLMTEYPKRKNQMTVTLYGTLIILSFFVFFFLESKVSIIIFCLLLIYHLVSSFSKKLYLGYISLFAVLILCILIFNKRIKVSYEHAMDFRLAIWEESFELIKENPIFGSMKYAEKDLLNYKHYLKGKYYFMDSDLNSHNQYLSIFIKYGVFGAFILSMYGILFFNCISKLTTKAALKEFLGFAIIISIALYIENLFDRHHGIVFCTVFFNYYLIKVENEKI
ncbi:O-antigen ligase family protein [Subsaxibacter sp. CAU 1640]|uniref:O-antigen ligase family protein n=1 Tax=Subsaxibacter sp. CAU 1640 TaxID=2933271 RepID=UPI0020047415|nr:O-antigen ligase family protein [Subsaxibacter sp. CAU 1640]MCK7589533.1 O-antigen ligase family protein [Subsaxibacter sp. CAU 1640]